MEFNFSTFLSLIFTLYVFIEIFLIKRLFNQKNQMMREQRLDKPTKQHRLTQYLVTFLKMHPLSKPFSRNFNYRIYQMLVINVLITTIVSTFLRNVVTAYVLMLVIDIFIVTAMLIFKLSRRKSIEWMLKQQFQGKIPRQISLVRQFHVRLYVHQLIYAVVSFIGLVALGHTMYKIYQNPQLNQVIASTATILINNIHRLISLIFLSLTSFTIDKILRNTDRQFIIHFIEREINQEITAEAVPIESEHYNQRVEFKTDPLQEKTQENLNNQQYAQDIFLEKLTKRAQFASKLSNDFASKSKISNEFKEGSMNTHAHVSLPPIVVPTIEPSPQHISPVKFDNSIKSIKFNSLTVKRQKPAEEPTKEIQEFQAENQQQPSVLNEVSMNCNMDQVVTKPLQKYQVNLDDTIRRKSRNRQMDSRPMSCQHSEVHESKENQPKSYFTNSLLPPLNPHILPHILPPLQPTDFLQTKKLTQSDDESYDRKKKKRRQKKYSQEENQKHKSPYLQCLPKILKKQQEMRNSSCVMDSKSKSQKRRSVLKQTMQLQIIKKTISSDIDTVYT